MTRKMSRECSDLSSFSGLRKMGLAILKTPAVLHKCEGQGQMSNCRPRPEKAVPQEESTVFNTS